MQFAYRPNQCTLDTIAAMLHIVLFHLDKHSENTTRCMFLDFSSAFNTIPPMRLVNKLVNLFNWPDHLVKWTFDFLTSRTQFVFIPDMGNSDVVTTNIGSPQGCILSPFLFSVYTNDLVSTDDTVKIIKYADDTLIVGNITKDNANTYCSEISRTIKWCSSNGLILNENKTKEVRFDFRKSNTVPDDVIINSKSIEVKRSIKYLGCCIDNKLTFNEHVSQVISKASQRRFLVYRLYSFNVNRRLISLAYDAMVRSVITYALPCFYHFL